MLPKPPSTCPYSTPTNGYMCVGEECAYYRMREPTTRYRQVSKILFSEDTAT